MRTTPYILAFFSVSLALVLNILSYTRSDWLVVRSPEVLRTKITVTYGLTQRCERQVTRIPGPNNGKFEYTDFECRRFPDKVSDRCDKENGEFCTAWVSARHILELALGCAAASLCAIFLGIWTRSSRRRSWRLISGLILLHALSQIAAFVIVTEMYRTSRYPTFEQARIGPAYISNILSWTFDTLTAFAIIVAGVCAENGHTWAAGDRAYRPIGD